MRSLGEPLTPTALNALQAKLPIYRTEDDKFTAAAYLYRYNRISGNDELVDLAKRGYPHAFAVLAASMDAPSLHYILAGLSSSPDNVYLVSALGRWRNPAILKALLLQLRQHPNDSNLALAVARQGDSSAIADLRQCRLTTREETSRLVLSLALVRLKDAKSKELLHEVITTAQLSDSYAALVFDSMRYLKLAEGRQFAQDRVEKYLDEKLSNTTSA